VNNLHRDLAPISDAAWREIDEAVAQAFTSTVACRRVVDVVDADATTAAISTGHLRAVESPGGAVRARQRLAVPVVELRVEFELDRSDLDDVERGAQDGDWTAAGDAAVALALAEDRAIIEGYPAAGITGVRETSRERTVPSPTEVTSYPDAVARALALLRDAGVAGRYALLLGEEEWVRVTAGTEHGLPVTDHLRRLLDGDVLPARALESPLVLSARGGDFALHLVEDVSVGFLSHTEATVRLYVEEAFTFLDYTAEAAVPFVARTT
jgi:uncharacterized linocin/CFP29 family protein